MTMWDIGNGAISEFKDRGFKSWPNPFTGLVKDIDVLACQDTWQAKVKFYGGALGNWFWSNFVPSPVEITRKTITGSYKCGFFFHPGFGSPVDLIWEDSSVSEILLEISSPFTTALFYLWATETLFAGLNTYQSLIYAMERCGLDHDETLLSVGEASAFAGGAEFGTPGFYTVLQDRRHLYASPGGAIDVYKLCYLRMDAFGYVVNGGCNVSTNIVSFMAGTIILDNGAAQVDMGGMGPGDKATFHLSFSGLVMAGAYRINWNCINDAVALERTTLIVQRWTVSLHPEKPEKHCKGWSVHPHHSVSKVAHWWEKK